LIYVSRRGGYAFPELPLSNVWLGVSVEDQATADERIPLLLKTPAAVRFISAEPLLGPIDLTRICEDSRNVLGWNVLSDDYPTDTISRRRLDWVIVGGESGKLHRAMELSWAESIAEQCTAARIPLFVKQDSGPKPGKQYRLPDALWARKEFPLEVGDGAGT
jgi:protein gp37